MFRMLQKGAAFALLLVSVHAHAADRPSPLLKPILDAEALCVTVFTPTWDHRMPDDPAAYPDRFRQCAEVEMVYMDRVAGGLKFGVPGEARNQKLAAKRARLSAVDFTTMRAEYPRSPMLQWLFRLDIRVNTNLLWWLPLYRDGQSISQHAALAERRGYAIGRAVCKFLGLFEPDHCRLSLEP